MRIPTRNAADLDPVVIEHEDGSVERLGGGPPPRVADLRWDLLQPVSDPANQPGQMLFYVPWNAVSTGATTFNFVIDWSDTGR